MQEVGKSAVRRSYLILLPTIVVTAALAYIDRSNVAYAATSIKKTLNISNSQYGLGSGLLYVSYCFFQVRNALEHSQSGTVALQGIEEQSATSWVFFGGCI